MDKIYFSAVSLSILCNFFMWFVLSPVIVFNPRAKVNSELLYLGTVSVGKRSIYNSEYNSELKSGFISKVLQIGNLYAVCNKEVYEQRLGDEFLNIVGMGVKRDRDLAKLIIKKAHTLSVRKRDSVFFKGQLYFFPNGKKYGFVPEYLYPNMYRMLIIFRYVERGYK